MTARNAIWLLVDDYPEPSSTPRRFYTQTLACHILHAEAYIKNLKETSADGESGSQLIDLKFMGKANFDCLHFSKSAGRTHSKWKNRAHSTSVCQHDLIWNYSSSSVRQKYWFCRGKFRPGSIFFRNEVVSKRLFIKLQFKLNFWVFSCVSCANMLT